MLARPSPGALAARVWARLDAGEAVIDIGDEPEPTHLAIGDNIDAGFGLLLDDRGNCRLDPARIELGIKWRAMLLRLDHRQQIGRPRQAANMRGQYAMRAVLHPRLPGCGASLALLELAVDGPRTREWFTYAGELFVRWGADHCLFVLYGTLAPPT